MLNIEDRDENSDYGYPLLRLGFRPFFLGAGVFAVVSILIWMLVYVFGVEHSFSGMSATIWHAHEMIFGFAMAVITGFLLAAIKNWTGQQTLRGPGLAALFSLWILARIIPLTGLTESITLLAVIDLLFMFFLIVATAIPVLKAKQYKQLGIVSKLVLLMLSNTLFYLGVSGIVEEGIRWGLYSGLYMIIALLFVMARRVVPFFIVKGIDGQVEINNRAWVDMSSLILLATLWILDVFTGFETAVMITACLLFILHVIRMTGWHTKLLWQKPLLWVLYIAYGSLVFGFALKAAEIAFDLPSTLSIHAYTYGGIGVMTIGMMSRVILGHTGRNVFEPPLILFWCFALLICGAIARVVLPLFNMELYTYWIGISLLLWIVSFLIFLMVYTPMLIAPRVDGRDG